ncbi:conjugal transfer protein TraF [Salinisphaera sp. P385]|uniref:Conjugal transfer protein TraF n=1 Tax=Spectribacter acetivorans TaxID=3075603 RepID=A0ABU3B8R0_9GAMM|nr:conjugal transfer protein TraF [Salinisphaera sp. P385]MDT0618558.1 conjugal transfer protein TraF [Salinisphaera sp. P385]
MYKCAHILFVAALAVPAMAAGQPDRYYDDNERGWFWYEPEPEPAPEIEPPDLTPPPPKAQVKVIKPDPIEPQPPAIASSPPQPGEPEQGPPAMSSAWLRENLETYLWQALDDPSMENVTAYLYLQRLMMDRSTRFADATQVAIRTDPLLDASIRRPLAQGAQQMLSRRADQARTKALGRVASNGGLIYVFDESCKLCDLQVTPLKSLAGKYDMEVSWISADGATLKGVPKDEIVVSPELAFKLSPPAMPAVFMAYGAKPPVHLTSSFLSMNDLESGVLAHGVTEGWITQAEYEATKPRNNYLISLDPDELPDEAATEDPAEIIRFLRSRVANGETQ